jgi:hypothetical protein
MSPKSAEGQLKRIFNFTFHFQKAVRSCGRYWHEFYSRYQYLEFRKFKKNDENFFKLFSIIFFSVFSREINRKRIFLFRISLLFSYLVWEHDWLQYFEFSKNQVRNMTWWKLFHNSNWFFFAKSNFTCGLKIIRVA